MGSNPSATLGLIAGQGELPEAIVKDARDRGYRIVTVALEGLAEPSLFELSDEVREFNVGKVGSVIKYLKKNGVSEAVMAGKVPKAVLYGKGIKPDLRAVALLLKLKDRRDDSILGAISAEFEKEGIRFMDMKDFCGGLMMPPGVLSRRRPDRDEEKDIDFGFRMAKEIGRLDIGQAVVVKKRAVMAVEAIEGTDEAIRRGGALAGGGAVVVKVMRPGQDARFDVPAAGMKTLESMVAVGARVLALEAGKSILMDREDVLRKADEEGIAVVGVEGPE